MHTGHRRAGADRSRDLDRAVPGATAHRPGRRRAQGGAVRGSRRRISSYVVIRVFGRRTAARRGGACGLPATGRAAPAALRNQGAGKSTLALRLIDAGFELEGDEHVFVDVAWVVARPRGCRSQGDSLPYLPDKMAAAAIASPCYHNYDGERILQCRSPDAWFHLADRAGSCRLRLRVAAQPPGFSLIRPLQPSALVQFLINETGSARLTAEGHFAARRARRAAPGPSICRWATIRVRSAASKRQWMHNSRFGVRLVDPAAIISG